TQSPPPKRLYGSSRTEGSAATSAAVSTRTSRMTPSACERGPVTDTASSRLISPFAYARIASMTTSSVQGPLIFSSRSFDGRPGARDGTCGSSAAASPGEGGVTIAPERVSAAGELAHGTSSRYAGGAEPTG